MKRSSYQNGSVVRKPRKKGPDVWVLRYMEDGKQRARQIGTIEKFRTKAAAQKEASKSISEINERLAGISVAGLCDRFLLEGMKDIRPHSQATYRSFLKRVRMEWADWRVEDLAKNIMAAEKRINGYQTLPVPERVEPDYIAKGKIVKGKVTPARPARDVSKRRSCT